MVRVRIALTIADRKMVEKLNTYAVETPLVSLQETVRKYKCVISITGTTKPEELA